jgi:hypothetical protein
MSNADLVREVAKTMVRSGADDPEIVALANKKDEGKSSKK